MNVFKKYIVEGLNGCGRHNQLDLMGAVGVDRGSKPEPVSP